MVKQAGKGAFTVSTGTERCLCSMSRPGYCIFGAVESAAMLHGDMIHRIFTYNLQSSGTAKRVIEVLWWRLADFITQDLFWTNKA